MCLFTISNFIIKCGWSFGLTQPKLNENRSTETEVTLDTVYFIINNTLQVCK